MKIPTALQFTVLTAAVLLFLSVLAGVGSAAPSTAAVGFTDGEVTDQRGDVATIQLQLVDTDDATLLIRAAERDYAANLRVHDGNGDGTVRVQFNTFRGLEQPGQPAFGTASDADHVTVMYQSTDQSLPVLDAGRYNLIASTENTRIAAVLHLEESNIGDSHTRVTSPDGSDNATTNEPTADGGEAEPDREGDTDQGISISVTDAQSETVAQGDHVESEFEISGVGGALESAPPARNLVFANDSQPGAQTTHVLQVTPNRSVDVNTITIDYNAGDGDSPSDFYQLSQRGIHTLGVDTTGDGSVDRSLQITVASIHTNTNGQMTISFDRTVSVSETDTIIAEYDVTNPNTTGSDDVSVALNGGDYAETGQVVYGPAGDGTLGYGLDLRLQSTAGTDLVAPLAATTVEYDSDANALVARTNTTTLDPGDYTLRLTISDSSPFVSSATTMRERFAVAEPEVSLANVSATDSRLAVTADTNLAPGNQLIIQVQAMPRNGGSSYLSQCVTSVRGDGTLSCEFDFSRPVSEYTIDVSVIRNGAVVAGPVQYP